MSVSFYMNLAATDVHAAVNILATAVNTSVYMQNSSDQKVGMDINLCYGLIHLFGLCIVFFADILQLGDTHALDLFFCCGFNLAADNCFLLVEGMCQLFQTVFAFFADVRRIFLSGFLPELVVEIIHLVPPGLVCTLVPVVFRCILDKGQYILHA